MEYTLFSLLVIITLSAYIELSKLKRQIIQQQKQLNELCELTGHEKLSSYYISDELKEIATHMKNIGKEVEAVRKIREETSMPLVEAKQYIDKL